MSNSKFLPLSVDIVIFSLHDGELKAMLVRRSKEPFKGKWALPGGIIDQTLDKDIVSAAGRQLQRTTGVKALYLEQVGTFGDATRDPRGWTVSVTYFALMPYQDVRVADNENIKWVTIRTDGPAVRGLAFDHLRILKASAERLRSKVEYTGIIANALGRQFTLPELQRSYEIILGEPLAKVQFRRSIERAGIVEETGLYDESRAGRPAKLYQFTPDANNRLFFPRSMLTSANQSSYPRAD